MIQCTNFFCDSNMQIMESRGCCSEGLGYAKRCKLRKQWDKMMKEVWCRKRGEDIDMMLRMSRGHMCGVLKRYKLNIEGDV